MRAERARAERLRYKLARPVAAFGRRILSMLRKRLGRKMEEQEDERLDIRDSSALDCHQMKGGRRDDAGWEGHSGL